MADEKKPVGRQLKFTDPKELQRKIDAYFGECDPHLVKRQVEIKKQDGKTYWAEREVMSSQKPYTVTGLAIALDTTRRTLLDYQNPDYYPEGVAPEVVEELTHTIGQAKRRVQEYAEQYLFSGKPANGAVFSLKNNWDWQDKTVVDQTNRDAKDELDELDDQKKEVADKAKEAADASTGGDKAS